jgi:hypothetical protein
MRSGLNTPRIWSRLRPNTATIDFTEEERAALSKFLREAVAADRYPMSAHWRPIKSALGLASTSAGLTISPAIAFALLAELVFVHTGRAQFLAHLA